jgi:multidrug efflux pump
VVGRLFREFAMTLAIAILMSAVVSLTLTPMMCARLLKHGRAEQHESRQRGLVRPADRRLRRTLRWVLDHQPLTAGGHGRHLVLTALLYVAVPKGFFPVQDTGLIQGMSEASRRCPSRR